jgi:hypothetical protein
MAEKESARMPIRLAVVLPRAELEPNSLELLPFRALSGVRSRAADLSRPANGSFGSRAVLAGFPSPLMGPAHDHIDPPAAA